MQRNAFEHYSIEELYDMTDIDIEEIDRDTEYKNETGFLNIRKQRNADNTYEGEYNCGGFALNTFSWYKPYEGAFEWREQLLYDWLSEYVGQNGEFIDTPQAILDELEHRLLTRDVLYMLRQFKGKLRRVGGLEELWAGERLIAYRIGLKGEYNEETETFEEFDIDFHYRYYDEEEKCWIEKLGGGPIRKSIGDIEDIWAEPFWSYSSDIVYLALQLS